MQVNKAEENLIRFSELLNLDELGQNDQEEFEGLFKMLMAEINNDPLNVDGHFILARACSRFNDKDNHFELFFLDKVIMLKNDHFFALVRRAEIYSSLSRYSEAFQNIVDAERVASEQKDLQDTPHYQTLVELKGSFWGNAQAMSELSQVLSSANSDKSLEEEIVKSQKMVDKLEADTISDLMEIVKHYRQMPYINDLEGLKQNVESLKEENASLKRSILEISVKFSLMLSENINTRDTYSFQQWLVLGKFMTSHDQDSAKNSSIQVLAEIFVEDILCKYLLILFARLKYCTYGKNTKSEITHLFQEVRESYTHVSSLFSYLTRPGFDLKELDQFYNYVVSYLAISDNAIADNEVWLARIYAMTSLSVSAIILKCFELERQLNLKILESHLLKSDAVYHIKIVVNHIISPLRREVNHDEYSKTVNKFANIKIDALSFFNFFRDERKRQSSKSTSSKLRFFSIIDEKKKAILAENDANISNRCYFDTELYSSKALVDFTAKFGDKEIFWLNENPDIDCSATRVIL